MTEQIKNLENEKRELAENISACVQKTNNAMKCLEETIRQKKMPSEKTLNFKENLKTIERVNEHLNDVQIARAKLQAVREQNAKSPHLPGVSKTRSEGSMQRAMTTGDCSLEEGKKKMQDHHAASGSLKEREEDGFQRQVKKVRVLDEISGQRTMDTEGKVDMNGSELVGKQQLLAAKEEAELAEEETRLYKIRLEECHGQMREAEVTWRHQVTLAEKKAQDSSLRSQELEREISELRSENSDLRRVNSDLRKENSSELRREVAHLKQRLDAICRRRQAEEYMRQEPTPGGPYRLHPPLRASGRGGAPVRNGTTFPAQEAEETQATPWAGGPQPFRGPARVACPESGPSSSSGPPAPGPPLSPVQPRPPPPAAPLGKRKA
ncbi:transport and Golgi organization protein 1 homolog [Camelus bactrianus]|uniref:Transport and Golgi organization protein 1 homolog n=1 Tax=Camelus bactrianus TaxID=9837 RepID=A0AC58PDV0_CAMBA